jgi:acyl carrier protein
MAGSHVRIVFHSNAVSPNHDPSPEDDPVLRDALKRCAPATYYAACKFKAFHRADDLRVVVLGVIERFVERELRPKLQHADDSLRLREDLGLDSLTMMEVVMIAEEVLNITVSNEELTHLRTFGEVHAFILMKTMSPASIPAKPPVVNNGTKIGARSTGEGGLGEIHPGGPRSVSPASS